MNSLPSGFWLPDSGSTMPSLTIDNLPVTVPDGATILDAAKQLHITIPTLCHRPGCSPQTSCLACVVRVDGIRRLVPSCATAAVEGMVVHSETEEVHDARRTAIELLLADHAGDCLAPCQNVCPAHMDIPKMLRQISAGEFHDALVTVKRAIALPAVLGRICPELCEKGCRRAEKDESVSICRLKRFVADTDLETGRPYQPRCAPSTGKKVAIVGAGPAGLAAAYYLQQLGEECTIFDQHPLAGGPLRYSIDKTLLSDEVLDAELQTIWTLGATFIGNTKLGKDITLDHLRSTFDAVLLAIGDPSLPSPVHGRGQGEGLPPSSILHPPSSSSFELSSLALPLQKGRLKADPHTMMTPLPGVFVAGAALAPSKHAIRSCADGRAAARVIHGYVTGHPTTRPAHEWTVRLGHLNECETATLLEGSTDTPRAPYVFSETTAPQESDRCLHCACAKQDTCLLRTFAVQTGANPKAFQLPRKPVERIQTHPSLIYEPGKCIACGLCIQIARRAGEPLGLAFVGRGFSIRVATPFSEPLSEALERAARECAEACPTAALTLRSDCKSDMRTPTCADGSGHHQCTST